MNLDDVMRQAPRRKKSRRVGRGAGSGSGKTCGRGQKGQKSRSGYAAKPIFEGGQMPIARRIPKVGFNNKWRTEYEVINLDSLESRFEDGATVDPESIQQAGLIKKKDVLIKILGRGELKKKLDVRAHKFSKSAAAKIEAAGGTTGSV